MAPVLFVCRHDAGRSLMRQDRFRGRPAGGTRRSKSEPIEVVRAIRDDIAARVGALVAELDASTPPWPTGNDPRRRSRAVAHARRVLDRGRVSTQSRYVRALDPAPGGKDGIGKARHPMLAHALREVKLGQFLALGHRRRT